MASDKLEGSATEEEVQAVRTAELTRMPIISPNLELDSDQILVRRAREGDFTAFEQLFERHRTLAFRYAYQMVPRRDDAEDIVQEALVRAYQNLPRYRDEAKFTTWLLRIVTNLCTDQARMSNRRTALEQQEAQGALTWMTLGETEDPVEQDRVGHVVREMKSFLRQSRRLAERAQVHAQFLQPVHPEWGTLADHERIER